MKRLACVLLACTAWTTVAAAMDEPAPSQQDSRIRTASYSPGDIIHITSTDLSPVQIVLQDGEQVASFAGQLVSTATRPEDAGKVHDWFIRFSGNAIVLQPLKPEPTTLLFVDTKAPNETMRHYRFQLDTRDPPGPATAADPDNYVAVNMVYPEVIAAERREAAERRAAARVQAAAMAGQQAAAARLAQAPFASTRNWRYEAQNIDARDTSCAVIGPSRVAGISDDGQQTTLLFAPHATLPVPYILDQDGKESVVQHTQAQVADGMVMTLSAVVPRIILRRGNRACAFTNLAYDPAGHSPGTGTISADVVRQVHQ
jgi:type IV secretory pathway VirB9-like protein